MTTTFRMGRLDHVHLRVPNRNEAVIWYRENLGFEVVEEYAFWAEGFEGGPVQISADGGKTTLALFEASEGHPMVPQTTGVAFSVDYQNFTAFIRSLPGKLKTAGGQPLQASDIVDFDLCWAYDFVDPWGNHFELNSYDYAAVKQFLLDEGISWGRYWPAELYDEYKAKQR